MGKNPIRYHHLRVANPYCRGQYSFLYINQRVLLCGSRQILFPRPLKNPHPVGVKGNAMLCQNTCGVREIRLMVRRKLNEGSKNEFPIFVGNPMSSSLQFCHGSVDPSFQIRVWQVHLTYSDAKWGTRCSEVVQRNAQKLVIEQTTVNLW